MSDYIVNKENGGVDLLASVHKMLEDIDKAVTLEVNKEYKLILINYSEKEHLGKFKETIVGLERIFLFFDVGEAEDLVITSKEIHNKEVVIEEV